MKEKISGPRVKPGAAPKGCILTIEDDAAQRRMIQKALEKRGYVVFTAENGEQGLQMAQVRKPDLILLDVIMPGIDGKEVCKRLKAYEETKDIPVLFLTSIDAPKEIVEHYYIGGEIHLTKPINARELVAQVEASLKEFKKI